MNLLHVLLVEDAEIVRMVHERMIGKLGCIVDLAVDGSEALEKSKYYHDIIFMDIGLPDISGTEVIKSIRARKDVSSQVYIVALTGYVQEEEISNFLSAGADSVLFKPVESQQLAEALSQAMSRKNGTVHAL